MAWMDISAPASRASSRRSQWVKLPRPGGSPKASTSTTPPRVSPAFLAASISATMAWLVAGSKQRTGSASIAAASPGPGMTSSGARTSPSATTWLRISAPRTWLSRRLATSPSATRAAVSRALARSSTGRASAWPYFCIPARSA